MSADSRRPMPVTILSGFLGAGKTTLLNYILRERHGLRIAVIENEFGEVDIDSDLVLTSEEEIYQLTNGCICCTVDVRNDLVAVLKKLMARRGQFDHIVVETSGLADPGPVAATFFVDEEVASWVKLDAIVTLIDAKHILGHLDDPKLAHAIDNQAVDQIVVADRIVINKTDLVGEKEIAAIEARVRGLNQTAQILRSSYAQVDLDSILGIGAFTPPPGMTDDPNELEHDEHAHAHEHSHDPSVTSVALSFDRPFDRTRLEGAVRSLLAARGDDIFRLKGIVQTKGDERRWIIQAVHQLVDIKPGAPWGARKPAGKIVLIGRGLNRDELERRFGMCLAAG